MDITSLLLSVGVPGQYVAVVAAVVGLVSVLMTVLPVPSSSTSVYGRIHAVLTVVGANVGNAANAKTAPSPLPKS